MATRHGAQPPSAESFVALGEGPVIGLFVRCSEGRCIECFGVSEGKLV